MLAVIGGSREFLAPYYMSVCVYMHHSELCVCMCVYVDVTLSVCVHVYTCIVMYVCMHVCVSLNMCVCVGGGGGGGGVAGGLVVGTLVYNTSGCEIDPQQCRCFSITPPLHVPSIPSCTMGT